mmetsp:Transcript_39363/g.47723  ORF Transcript_39363/g.47723 Transcript_39363/m.47723 type:complete len:242 (-) Transcript_39363:344-1069(-)|eukprot:CAMPEP_0197852042 /NCGR_PEP_ID=MMETSP1438-20131217/19521_1 /TAXON_ID=1461541 /ORGANISM="Pterosperma sp., Strain CCMP1384" /LENGTH=241 /DNA_ID=CAMNT_0043465881 /DNA_START=313 /DNA_END=1038 /DNA_ORIENTATION=+
MFNALRSRASQLSEPCSRIAAMFTATRQMGSQSQKPPVVIQLKKPYPGLGTTGEYVRVRPGHARNHLVPQGVARLLDRIERKEWEKSQQGNVTGSSSQQERAEKSRRKAVIGKLPSVLERFDTWALVLFRDPKEDTQEVRDNREVTAQMISTMIEKQWNIKLVPEALDLPEPLATLGTHKVPVIIDPKHASGKHWITVHIIHKDTPKSEWPLTKPPKAKKEDSDSDYSDDDDFDDEFGGAY